MIHPTSDVQTKKIGIDTQIWQYCVVLEGAVIGKNCNINCHVFIENDVVIGDNVTVKPGVQIWDGLRIEDDVFIGPNVTFTNDRQPRSKQRPKSFQKTILESYSSIGAGATILGGHTIGSYAMVGAGSVVTKDIPRRALAMGNPARVVGWLNKDGSRMEETDGSFIDENGNKWIIENKQLTKIS
jgi:UDP-2-acetamido-3-amino-2,3-dideoxy-glucuronate N-acetyltransferase